MQNTINYKWLNNFSKDDCQTAKDIFNSLQFFDLSDMEKDLFEIISKIDSSKTWALYPLMDKKYFLNNNYLDLIEERKILYQKNNNIKNDADSEYILMSLIRNYCRSNKHIINMPIRSDYKKKKIRNIAIITDIVASGTQVKDFIYYLIKDKTIKSYISFGLIENIIIIAHIATSYGIDRIKKIKIYSKNIKVKIEYARHARTIDTFFIDKKQNDNIKKLCKHYSGKEKFFLGYNDVGLLSLYEHKISNNVPAILIQNIDHWEPLFKNRRVNDSVSILKSHIVNESDKTILKVLNIIKICRFNLVERISENMNMDMNQSQDLIKSLFKAGYISKNNSLTPEGKKLFKKLNCNNDSENSIDKIIVKKYYPYYRGC